MFAGSTQGSHRVLTLIMVLAALAVTLVVLPSNRADALVAGSLAPTISSDQADYPPGGTVVLTGSNWQPGESVNIVVDDDDVDERDWQRDVTVTADENGDIRDEFQLPSWFVANYSVKATGVHSGVATTSFTDAVAGIEGKDKGGVNYRSTGGPLRDWDELDEIPMRLAFTENGTKTVLVTFSHTNNSGRRIPGIKDLVNWTAANNKITSLNAQLTDTSGEEWAYTVVANVASANNSNPGYVEFKAILAAGSHDYPGGSLHVSLSGDGNGTRQINPSDVIAANPDLVVDKTGPATAAPGSTIEYKIYYKNISTTDTATGAVITDILPSGLTFDSCSDSCTVTGNEVSWMIGNLSPGTGTDPNNPLFRTLRVKIPAGATNGITYVNNTDILSADAEQDLNNCGAADSDNNADNDNAACDNYDSLKTTVAVNGSPNAVDDSYNVNEDGALNVADGPNDVLANDSDPDGDTLTVTGNTQPSNGTLNLNSNGSFTYTPNANFSGTDSFTYTASDGNGGTATATVNVTVNPVNDTPSFNKGADQEVNEDSGPQSVSGWASAISAGPNEGSQNVSFVISSNSNSALFSSGPSISSGGNLTYTPAENENGSATIGVKIKDDGGTPSDSSDDQLSAEQTFLITVRPVNDAPSFSAGPNQSVNEDSGPQSVDPWATNVSKGPNNESGQSVDFVITNNTNSSLFSSGPSVSPNGVLTFTPDANKSGQAEITLKIKDDGGIENGGVNESATQSFTITVNPVNDKPVAVNDSYSVNEDATLTRNAADGVLNNDTDVEGSGLTAVLINGPAHGTLTLNPDGSFTYTPAANYAGPDSFTYKANDGNDDSNVATVNITVNPVNDTPVAKDLTGQDDQVTTPEDTPEGITLQASDVDSTNLSFSILNGPAHGNLSGSGENQTYTPNANYNGPDTFTFKVCDDSTPEPLCDEGAVDIVVTPVNDAPVAQNDARSVNEDQTLNVDAPGVLGNDTDIDSANLTAVLVNGPAHGTLNLAPNGSFSYTPADNYNGTDEFSYKANDGTDDSNVATVTITVNPANDAPVIDLNPADNTTTDDEVQFTEGDPNGVFADEGQNLSITDIDSTQLKSASIRIANHKSGDSLLTSASDPNIQITSYDTTTGELKFEGTATLAAYRDLLRTVRFDNNSDDPNTADRQVEFFVTDEAGNESLISNTAISVVKVAEVNDNPEIGENGVNNNGPVNEGSPVTITVTATDPDTPASELRYSFDCNNDINDLSGDGYEVGPQPGNSTQCTYPDNGTYPVNVRVTDGEGGSDTGSTTVQVNNVDPSATFAATPDTINEGQSVNLSLNNMIDPGTADTHQYRFDCGDGTFGEWTDMPPSGEATINCPTTDDSNLVVRGQVRDDDGGLSEIYQETITVNNAAPRVVLDGPTTADESQTEERTYTFTVTDAGSADTFNVEGDPTCGANGQLVSGSLQTTASGGSFKCRFPDGDSTTNVEIQVRDDDGALDADSQRVVIVNVANVAPVLTIAADQNSNEGQNKSFVLGSFTDPGDDGPWSVTVNWGDGSADTTFDSASPGNLPDKPHTYADDGTYTVRVTVAEAGGAPSDSETFTVTVSNVAPTANDDQMTTTELQEVTGNLLDNDSDPGNDLDRASLEILSINALNTTPAGPLGGVVTIGTLLDGNVTYKPNRGFVDTDSFRYRVCDDDGDCSQANVEVIVGPVDCNAQGVIRGTSGADILRGTPGDDVICAFGGNDRIYAGAGDDLLVAAAGLDRMWGEGGSDVMRGGEHTDAMDSGSGDDWITGDTGRDIIMARGGIDYIEIRDGSGGDAANGGAGRDECKRDAGDQIVSCELR